MEEALKQAQNLVEKTASTASKLTSKLTLHLIEKTKEFGFTGYDIENIERDLESNYEKDKLVSLKKLIELMSRGEDVQKYFPCVVKQVAFPSFQVKRLIYLYLLHYAEKEPDLSLLSINTFQKDLSDPNPMIRTVALRVLSSIKVPLIVPIIIGAFKKGLTDLSPYVRKAVAISIPKCHRLDATQDHILLEIVETLLTDKSTIVLGPTIKLIHDLFPDRLDLIHKHYKKLVRLVGEADEWSQLQIVQTMIRYTRMYFTHHPSFNQLDGDFQVWIHTLKPLLYSRNPLVVLTITVYFYDLGYTDLKQLSTRTLMRCLTRPKNEQYMILVAIKELVIKDKSEFVEHIGAFFVYKNELFQISVLKLEILELLCTDDNVECVYNELKAIAFSTNTKLAIEAVRIWKRLAGRIPSISSKTVQIFISLLSHKDSEMVGEVVISIKTLIQAATTDASLKEALITYLVSIYSSISVPLARASILWLVRFQVPFKYAPDCLRIALQDFIDQEPIVKRQTLLLAALLKVTTPISFVEQAFPYVIKWAKYDKDMDIRDQSRFVEKLVQVPDLAKHLLTRLAVMDLIEPTVSEFRTGTLSQLLNVRLDGYEDLPGWSDSVVGKEERNQTVFFTNQGAETWNRDRVTVTTVKTVKRAEKEKKRIVNLDEFYADVEAPAAVSVSSDSSESTDSEDDSTDSES